MNKFSDGWTTEGHQYYKEILGEMKNRLPGKWMRLIFEKSSDLNGGRMLRTIS